MSTRFPTVKEFLDTSVATDRELLEHRFFNRVYLPNKTWKTTYSHRLDDVNQAFLPGIKSLETQGPLHVMDVGVSSGISTLEWYDFLQRQGISCDLTATDLLINAHYFSSPSFALLRDKMGTLLHFDVFGRGYPPFRPWHVVLKGIAVGAVGIASWFGKTERRFVRLLTAKLPANIKAIEDDLTAPNNPAFVEAFDVVRVANLLNLTYFNEEMLLRMLANLRQRLKPNGLLIICRTLPDGSNHGTSFSLSGARLKPIDRIGSGSEVEKLCQLLDSPD